jgi:hypothetical protein
VGVCLVGRMDGDEMERQQANIPYEFVPKKEADELIPVERRQLPSPSSAPPSFRARCSTRGGGPPMLASPRFSSLGGVGPRAGRTASRRTAKLSARPAPQKWSVPLLLSPAAQVT